MDAPNTSPAASASQADTHVNPPSRDTTVAGAETGGEPRVITVDTAGGTAVVLHRGVAHLIGIDADLGPGGTGAVMPLWSATTREADEALADVDDDLIVELLNDWHRDDMMARAS